MKRIVLLSLTALLFSILASAGNINQNEEALIKAKIQAIYADVNKVYACVEDIDLDRLYTTREWQETYAQVEAIDAKKEASEEMFFVEDMRWTNGMIVPLTPNNFEFNAEDENTVWVYFDLCEESGDCVRTGIIMVNEDSEWKINSWVSPWGDWNTLEDMKNYIINGGKLNLE